jgi:hypothetical protein
MFKHKKIDLTNRFLLVHIEEYPQIGEVPWLNLCIEIGSSRPVYE